MEKSCCLFKKTKIIPKKPNPEKKNSYKKNNREIIQKKKNKLQIRTGKNLKIIPVDYNGKFKKINI